MRDPQSLVTTDQLAAMLGDPTLRLYDCTTTTVPPPPGSDVPYIAVSGQEGFETAHIPGASHLDIQGEFADRTSKHLFMMAPTAQMAEAFGRHGIGPDTRVVLYNRGNMWMSTRFWWMLRALGFDAAVLDGGFDKWQAEARPTEAGPPRTYPKTTFTPAPRAGMFVGRDDVRAALHQPGTVIVNALGDDLHRGVGPSRYGRPGRIPGSVQVSAATLINPATKGFTTLEDARAKFEAKGVTPDQHIICYCGGGISTTIDLFLLHQLGYDDITLYDASVGEWARDETLPIEIG